jgi:hypothetical protein
MYAKVTILSVRLPAKHLRKHVTPRVGKLSKLVLRVQQNPHYRHLVPKVTWNNTKLEEVSNLFMTLNDITY